MNDNGLSIAAKHILSSNDYERFMAGGELTVVEWVWLFEVMLHSGCDITAQWAFVKQRIDSHPDRQGLPPIRLNTFEEQLQSCELYDSMTDEETKAEYLDTIDSIKRELAKL